MINPVSADPARGRPRPVRLTDEGALTVDELARACRTTTRQVRALQWHGVVPHPRLVGRTGYYGVDHLERLRAALRLQDDGFSLAAIAALMKAWEAGATLAQVLGLPPRGEHGGEEVDAFDGWVVQRRGRLLSVVPTTVLAYPTAS